MNDTDIKISVISVVCNAEATIEDSLFSIMSQSYRNVEHIEVDDASTDRTVPVIHSY